MIYYVTHSFDGRQETIDKVKQIVYDFQTDDWENCYVSPLLAFPFYPQKEADKFNLMPIRLDLLSVCDVLLVASEPDKDVKIEMDFAKSVGMETYHV